MWNSKCIHNSQRSQNRPALRYCVLVLICIETLPLNASPAKFASSAFRFYLLFIACFTIGGGAGVVGQRWYAHYKAVELQQLQHSVANLKAENDDLIKQLNILGVELEVARIANQHSGTLLQKEFDNQLALRKELSFYQKVMAPELDQEGFIIDSFEVFNTHSENYYRFALVLLQYDKHRDTVKGNINVTIKGSKNGAPSQLNLTDTLVSQQSRLPFSFRYFEVIKGEFNLPAGFMPEQVIIESQLKEAKWGKRNLDRTFTWEVSEPILGARNT